MRLWSLHPRYLDPQGLVALWREGLLAQKVLAGKTKGYKHHPQLTRFRIERDPLLRIGTYLHHVAAEARRRGYNFDESKILRFKKTAPPMNVTRGQLKYECEHLLKKLSRRSPALYEQHKSARMAVHPLFKVKAGKTECWERVTLL
jgi:hypothetical protein